jgi:hypothetical protein
MDMVECCGGDGADTTHDTPLAGVLDLTVGDEDPDAFDHELNNSNCFDQLSSCSWSLILHVCRRVYWEDHYHSFKAGCVRKIAFVLWACRSCKKLFSKKPIHRYAVQPAKNKRHRHHKSGALTTQTAALNGTAAGILAKQRKLGKLGSNPREKNFMSGNMGVPFTNCSEDVSTSAPKALATLQDNQFLYTFCASLDAVSKKLSDQLDQVCPQAKSVETAQQESQQQPKKTW